MASHTRDQEQDVLARLGQAGGGMFAVHGNLDGDEATAEFQDRDQFIGMVVGTEEFLLPIAAVREIIMLGPLRWVPNAPEFVDGVINLRGTILPAINMRRLMGVGRGSATSATRVVIVRLERLTFGLIVDAITYVTALLPSEIETQSLPGKGSGAEFLGRVAKHGQRVHGILDLARVARAVAGREITGDDDEDNGLSSEPAA